MQGTTTLAVALVDLATTRVLAADSTLNPQVRFGPDVITRIHAIRGRSHGDARFTGAIRDGIARLADALRERAGVAPSASSTPCCAATRSSPTRSRASPSTRSAKRRILGGFIEPRALPFRTLGLPGRGDARARLLPQIRSHVGGDAVAAMLALDLGAGASPQLLIDLGTNTEIVATDGRHILARRRLRVRRSRAAT